MAERSLVLEGTRAYRVFALRKKGSIISPSIASPRSRQNVIILLYCTGFGFPGVGMNYID